MPNVKSGVGASTAAMLDPSLATYRRDEQSREQLLRRVRAEFDEMPCLRLTLAQAARLFTLRQDVCARVLDTLVHEHLLWRTADGRYARRAC